MRETIDTGATFERDGGGPVCAIDLKWSLWTRDRGVWNDIAPETLAHIRGFVRGDAQETGDRLVITTAPRKEIRFGRVLFSHVPNTDHFDVDVRFSSDWDDAPALVDSLGLDPDTVMDAFMEVVPWVAGLDSPGVEIVGSKTFRYGTRLDRVLTWIDQIEAQLLQADNAAWGKIVDWAKREEGE